MFPCLPVGRNFMRKPPAVKTTNADRRIDAILGRFRARRVAFMWVVHPTARPLDLADWLARRGLQEIEVVPGMARRLAGLPEAPPLPEGVEVREALELGDVDQFNEFAAWRWGVPEGKVSQLRSMLDCFHIGQPSTRTRFWMAWREGVPISKVGLHQGATSAGLYAVATKPEARGLGLASLLTLGALGAARDAGYEVAVLHSSPPAETLYQRLGFVTAGHFRLMASEPAVI